MRENFHAINSKFKICIIKNCNPVVNFVQDKLRKENNNAHVTNMQHCIIIIIYRR